MGTTTQDESESTQHSTESTVNERELPASYWALPHKGQILLLVLARLTEPLAYSSIGPYLYYMVRDFGYEDPSTISALSTLVMTSFALGQSVSAMFWGRMSDTRGRKPALVLGLLGTAVSIIIFGTAQNVYVSILGRVLCGLLNGNIGVMRTMIAEIIGDKKRFQSRAFAILPMTMNVGTIVGPMIGGLLANPAESMPDLFGNNQFLKKYPYILPNLFPIPLIIVSAVCTLLFTKETGTGPLLMLPVHRDPFLRLGNRFRGWWSRRNNSQERADYDMLNETADSYVMDEEMEAEAEAETETSETTDSTDTRESAKPTIKDVLTRPIKITLMCFSMMMLHNPAFQQIFPIFFSTPRMGPEYHQSWLHFNGGLGMSTVQLGFIMSIRGVIGILLQFFVYPLAAQRFGNAKIHRMSIVIFPVAYFLIPYMSFVNNESLGIVGSAVVITVVAIARTFATPPMTILITNASPSRKVLGTVHGLTHSVTSMARCVGPFVLGNIFSLGVKFDMINLAWWAMAALALVQNYTASYLEEWGE